MFQSTTPSLAKKSEFGNINYAQLDKSNRYKKPNISCGRVASQQGQTKNLTLLMAITVANTSIAKV